jgi:CO dehydrogenase maturation factor
MKIVVGKGGVGKTTIAACLARLIGRDGYNVIAVDADPATNLPQILGVSINKTIGDVAEEFRKRFERLAEQDIRKYDLLEYLIMRDCLVETEKFDFIAMGRGEGEGCYCYVNSLLSGILGKLVENYTGVLMNMEAGLEHLNRRLDRHANTLIIVVDNSMMSLRTAEKIKEIRGSKSKD